MVEILAAQVAIALPPIEEIRTVMAQQDLWVPQQEQLAALNAENLTEGLRSLDPFARYVPPSSLSLASKNSYQIHPSEIGVEVFEYKSLLWIRPDHGGPSDQAGIPEIGVLHAVNKKEVSGTDLTEASIKIDRAIRINWVALTVSESPDSKKKTYVVQPTKKKAPSIIWQEIEGYIVIRVREFVAHDSVATLLALYETLIKKNFKVILDLRSCSGGDLYESIKMAGIFVPENLPLVNTYDRSGFIKTYKSPSGQKSTRPIWLIVDSRTASSAEIFAGILHYYGIGLLIGERTTGKCVSQTLIPLSDGGGLWLTNLMVRFPDSSSCSEGGLRPDIYYPDITVSKLNEIIKIVVSNN